VLRLVALAATTLALAALAPASAREQHYGGTLTIAVSQEPGALDPTIATSSTSNEIGQSMCLPLYDSVSNHGTYEYAPILAASLPVASKDKRTYTVQLRKGVLFNDGTPMDADAVVVTVKRFQTYPGSTKTSDFADVGSVTAAGPYTVVYHMTERDSAFLASASYVLSPTAIATEGANFTANPVCVGPFMFDHRVAGDNVTLDKSPYYYKRAAIRLDRLVFKVIPDAPTAAAALLAGDVQVIDNLSTTQLPAIRASTGVRVLTGPQLGWQGIVINIGNKSGCCGVGHPLYQNIGTPLAQSAKLRQAFEEAIDRQALNRVVFDGLYQPSCTMVPPANAAWFPLIKVKCTPYDPADAKKLVAASGLPNPTVHLLVPTTTDRQRVSQFVQAEEAAVGINVVIDLVDNTTWTAMRQAGTFDTAYAARVPGIPDPDLMYRIVDTNGDSNYGGYSSPQLDYVLANGLKAAQTSARAVNYRVANQIVHDDRPIIVLFNATTYAAVSTSVSGVTLSYRGQVQLANAQFK
jgi:peptide/nickel transport system substrate-binding protein